MANRTCSVEGCDGRHKGFGYCGKHYQRFKMHGSVEDRSRAKRLCVGPECTVEVEVAQGLGMCRSHYKQHHLGKELTALKVATKNLDRPKRCTFPDCGRPHKARGYCKTHNEQLKAGKTLKSVEQRLPAGPCAKIDCARPRFANGLCTKHYASHVTRWRNYGLTVAEGLKIYQAQSGRCAICRTPAEIDSLHIDHDHSCCPTSRNGCGACVRGLLCQPCNIGLGYMRDDAVRLRLAIDYLESARAIQPASLGAKKSS